MISPKSLVIVFLCLFICIVACKKEEVTVPDVDTLSVSYGGGNLARPSAKTIRITAGASYLQTVTAEETNTIRLPAAVHDSLKQYLGSFPEAAIKSDPQVKSYSLLGAADNTFQRFIYIRKNPADTTSISIDTGVKVPYMSGFQDSFNQTLLHCNLSI